MRTVFYGASAVLTVAKDKENCKRRSALNEISILEDHAILVESGQILDVIPNSSLRLSEFDQRISVAGKTILPGLIDAHTHTVFAGNRAQEFQLKLRGASYEEIARAGGGIRCTMDATRLASARELQLAAHKHLSWFKQLGVTTVEIKSGYGLSVDDEIKILEVIKALRETEEIDIITTFLGAHIVPPEYTNDRAGYISLLTGELLPRIAERNLASFCDVFCERDAFSPVETLAILKKAAEFNLPAKVHTDQFSNIGGIDVALETGAVSVDHLEVVKGESIQKLAASDTVCVLLPGVSFFLKHPYAPARELIDAGALVALATDFNPGTSHIPNLHLIMQLAAINMGMTTEEIISSVTLNAAKALNIEKQTGSIEQGKQADFAIFDTEDYHDIIYTIGKNLNTMTVKNGTVVYQEKDAE